MWRLLRLWRVAKDDPQRPIWLLPATGMLAIYALEPLNFAVPLMGVVDDLILLPMLLHQIVMRLPSHITSQR